MPIYKYYTAQGCLAQGFTVSENCQFTIYGQNTQKPPVWKNRGSKEKKK